jgi:hypothetical protein
MSNDWTISGFKLQQQEQQQRVVGKPFPAGVSANPSGKTRGKDRLAELAAAFEGVHGRGPLPIELMHLRQASKLAAVAESSRTNAEQAVRAANTLHRVLWRLGLAKPPAKAKVQIPSLNAMLSRREASR